MTKLFVESIQLFIHKYYHLTLQHHAEDDSNATATHPPTSNKPPIGVTAPNFFCPVSTSTYKDPEKITIPARNNRFDNNAALFVRF